MSKPKPSTITYPSFLIVSEKEETKDLVIHEDNLVPLEDAFSLNDNDDGESLRTFILDERKGHESKLSGKGLNLGYYDNGFDFVVVKDTDGSLVLLPVYRK